MIPKFKCQIQPKVKLYSHGPIYTIEPRTSVCCASAIPPIQFNSNYSAHRSIFVLRCTSRQVYNRQGHHQLSSGRICFPFPRLFPVTTTTKIESFILIKSYAGGCVPLGTCMWAIKSLAAIFIFQEIKKKTTK
jgi:hypothetical protein